MINGIIITVAGEKYRISPQNKVYLAPGFSTEAGKYLTSMVLTTALKRRLSKSVNEYSGR